MSLPKHTASPLSSSPSKQLSRGTGGAQPPCPRTVERVPTYQQHPYTTTPEQPPVQQQAEEGFTPHGHDHAEQRHSLESPPQPPFQPFFTLIEDANSSEYYHPTVHYIFSDDDTDIVTEAALRSLETDHGSSPGAKGSSRWRQAAQEQQGDETYGEEDELEGQQSGSRKASSLPPPIPGVREHYIILDMEPSNPPPQHTDPSTQAGAAPGGTASVSTSPATQQHLHPQTHPHLPFTITSAHSLTPSWQVLDTQLTPAPTFDNNNTGEHPGSGSLMLKIKGTSGLPRDIVSRDKDGHGHQTLEEMMEQFEKRMDELRRVIEAGGYGAGAGTACAEAGAEAAPDTEQQQRQKAAENIGGAELQRTETHHDEREADERLR